ncbi:MAG: hypothetical protein P8J93_02460 [SAR86 cluster bacterium]|nr:hypothetical protein [SAR86 cluster bacterium]
MKVLKRLGIIALVYVVFVLLFETVFLGMYQPSFEAAEGCPNAKGQKTLRRDCGIPMIAITTTNDKGMTNSRMVARFVTNEKLYVSAHHWTRGWHKAALKNPNVQGEIQGNIKDYIAVPIEGEEFNQVAAEHPLPLGVKFMMGFPPPRQILRLDPLE